MNLEIVKSYWQEADALTADLKAGQQLSLLQLVDYLNRHLPPGSDKFTKTQINYLRTQKILHPEMSRKGKVKTIWRYTPEDVRRVLVVLLLKTKQEMNIKESKGWLRSFEEAQSAGVLKVQKPETSLKISTAIPTPVNLAYTLLRNRMLGTLITILANGEAEITPPDCLIAIRALDQPGEANLIHQSSWEEIKQQLETHAWILAASDTYHNLYIYTDWEQLQTNRPAVASTAHQHRWYILTMHDTSDLFYEVMLGLPEWGLQQPSIAAIVRGLAQKKEADPLLHLSNFLGLGTLLQAAFNNQLGMEEGTTLSALVEIISHASDAWDYCAVLVPEQTNNGDVKWLRVQECSSEFPSHLKNKRVEVGRFLAGWCYRYCQPVIVESSTENDSRISFFEEEGRPIAAAAIPAITEKRHVVGVLYVAKRRRAEEQTTVFSEELIAGLKTFGYLCGDILARIQVEVETVRGVAQLYTRPKFIAFKNLEDLLQRVVHEVQRGVSPEVAIRSWIYLLTLNIQTTYPDSITQWLCQQGAEMAGNFLATRFKESQHQDPLMIGKYELGHDQYVFAILDLVDLPERKYKEGIIDLQQEMKQIGIGKLSPDFYPSAVSFRYEDLHQQLEEKGVDKLLANLIEQTREALLIGPYIRRGHEALYKSDLDRAVSEFEDALRYAPNNWYGHKHLAEARMLQGTEQSIKQAIETCQKALQLKPEYASAHCLLADCLIHEGRFSEALREYERAMSLDRTRPDFLTRYGLALAGMTSDEYQEALHGLRQQNPVLAQQRNYLDQPWQEAIDKFDQAQKISTMHSDSFEEQRNYRADYHYQRGYAYLQAGYIKKAMEDFSVGRKLAPDNLALAQAYSYALSLTRKEQRAKVM